MKTKANASRGRRNLMRGVVLTVAMLATPALHAEDSAMEATRLDMLRKQMLEEQLQMQVELRELQRTLSRERTADAEQRRTLARTVEAQAAVAAELREELAAQRASSMVVYSLGGLALLLLGGLIAVATTRRARSQALIVRDQLDAMERRHRDELKTLRAALQRDLEQVAARLDAAGGGAAAPAARAPVANVAAASTRTASTVADNRRGNDETQVSGAGAAPAVNEPTRRTPLPSRPQVSSWQASPTVETHSSPERMANERIVMTSPLVTARSAPVEAAPGPLETTLEISAPVNEVATGAATPERAQRAASGASASAESVAASASVPASVDEANAASNEIELVYDPASIVIVEEEATSPADADARWQALTGAPLTQFELQPAPAPAPAARSEMRGNLTMENHSGTFAASHTNLADARRAGNQDGGNADLPFAEEPMADAAADVDAGASGAPVLGTPQLDTLDPTKVSVASVWPGPSAHTELHARLAELELQDDLRRHLNSRPELLRGLVEEALGVVLKPTATRTIEDWRLLVLDAWRRDNMQEALARTDSMILAATTDSDRTRAHMHRALVLDRIARMGGNADAGAAPAPVLDDPQAASAAAEVLSAIASPQDATARGAVSAAGGVAPPTQPELPAQPDLPEEAAPTPAALLREAVRLRREQRDYGAARRCLDALIERLDPRADALQARLWIRALINLALVEAAPGGDASRAIALYDRVEHALQGIPPASLSSAQATSAAQALFNRAVLRYERRNDVAGALDDYRRVVAQFGSRPDLDVVLTVAHALSNQAWLLAHVHKDAFAAAALYQDLDRRFGEHRHRDIAFLVASGLFSAAVLSARELRAPSAALDLYRKLVNRHELTADAAFVTLVAKALFNIGALLGAQPSGVEHAIEAYSSLIDRCADNDDPTLAEWVAGALVNKAGLLLRQGDIGAARASYARTVQTFANTVSVGAAEQVSRALFNLAGVASQQGDVEGAVQAYNELLQRHPPAETLRHEHIVARAFANLAYLHANPRKDTEQALEAFGRLLNRFKAREELELAEQCARALLGVGVLLATRRQDHAAARAAYEELAARYSTYQEPGIAVAVAKGLFNLASLQARQLNDLRATLATLTRLVDRYTGHREPEVDVRVVSGLLTRARVQERLADRDGARESFQQLLTRYAGHDDPRVHKYVEAAQRALGVTSPPRGRLARTPQVVASPQPGGQSAPASAASDASLAATQKSAPAELHDDFLS